MTTLNKTRLPGQEQVWSYFICGTTRPGYMGTTMNLQIILNTQKNPYLNQATQKNTCQIFIPKKIPESKISNPKKSFDHPRHLKSGVPPWVYRVVTLIHNDYELDLSQGNFGELLCYGKIILRGDVVGRKVPNITRGVDWVYLHCDLITRRTKNVPSDVLYSFSTSDLQVSYPFRKEPRRLEWQPVNKSYIDAIRVWVTDGRNNILDLNGTDIAISLMIEKKE